MQNTFLKEWLDEDPIYDIKDLFKDNAESLYPEKWTNGSAFVMLCALNGFSPVVQGWGYHQNQFGLNQEQALILIGQSSFVEGYFCGRPEERADFFAWLREQFYHTASRFGVVPSDVVPGYSPSIKVASEILE